MGNSTSQCYTSAANPHIRTYKLAFTYTVLEFIFTHSDSPSSLDQLLKPRDGHMAKLYAFGDVGEAAHCLCVVLAAISCMVPASDFNAAIQDPMDTKQVLKAQSKAKRDSFPFYTVKGQEMVFRHYDYQLFEILRNASRKLCILRFWGKTATRGNVHSEFQGFEKYSQSGKPAYVMMNGEGKLEAVEKAIALLARLVDMAGTVAPKGDVLSNSFTERLLNLSRDPYHRKVDKLKLGPFKRIFEQEKSRLLALKVAWESILQQPKDVWPRWGNLRGLSKIPSEEKEQDAELRAELRTPMFRKCLSMHASPPEQGQLRRRSDPVRKVLKPVSQEACKISVPLLLCAPGDGIVGPWQTSHAEQPAASHSAPDGTRLWSPSGLELAERPK
ncbi:hypothetical protein MMC24_005900 [Lignoscripta atroalba]|nr:hypothetical protein [Lignoscripta atroalba]